MRIPIFHVDAFASQTFRGNPAAVCLLDSWLDDEHLRKVAAENNLSATAFVVTPNQSFELRWFTVRREIRLCGHATLATAFLIFNLLRPELNEVRFTTRFSGILSVKKQGHLLAMDFPSFIPGHCAEVPSELGRAVGLEREPGEVLEANETLIAVLESSQAVRDARPDFTLLEQLHPRAVIMTAPGDDVDFVSRYFAPSYGVPEDPVTGSAHCSLTPYWSKRLGKARLHAQQLSERGGEIWCELAGDQVMVKGTCVLVVQGALMI